MPVPTHSPGCTTRLWGTLCSDCGEHVHFFSCSCGSRVFFDDPVPPWRPHGDRCVPYLIRHLRDVENQPISQIRRIVEQHAANLGISLPVKVQSMLRESVRPELLSASIHIIRPEGASYDFEGEVFGIQEVNFLKRLGYADNSISRAILGVLAKERYQELILRSRREGTVNGMYEFQSYVPARLLSETGVRVGSHIGALLRVVALPDSTSAWLADDVYVLTKR